MSRPTLAPTLIVLLIQGGFMMVPIVNGFVILLIPPVQVQGNAGRQGKVEKVGENG